MKIEPLPCNEAFHRVRIRDLKALVAQPGLHEKRACPGCMMRCPECGSLQCTCVCSPDCEQAPVQMSSDPDMPIEPNIVPLVHGLHGLRLCPPVWSCEGHIDEAGRPVKYPHVLFYTRSLAYPSIINRYLFNLHTAKKLSYRWDVRIADWGQSLDSAYSIAPFIGRDEYPNLARLHRDIRIISEKIVDGVKAVAQDFIGDIEQALKQG